MSKKLRKRVLLPLLQVLNDIVVETDKVNENLFKLKDHVLIGHDYLIMLCDARYIEDMSKTIWESCAMRRPITKYRFDNIVTEARYRINRLNEVFRLAMTKCSFGDECANSYLYDYTITALDASVTLSEQLDACMAQILATPEMRAYFIDLRSKDEY